MQSSPSRSTVLVVEDDAAVREALAEVLADEGHGVRVAAHGRAALDLLADADPLPDVILLDVMMPVMDGPTFRLAQRADARLAAIPTLFLSADARAAEVAGREGDAPWMAKPVDLDELFEAIDRLADGG